MIQTKTYLVHSQPSSPQILPPESAIAFAFYVARYLKVECLVFEALKDTDGTDVPLETLPFPSWLGMCSNVVLSDIGNSSPCTKPG
jgi:hypothetical protein